MTVRSTKPASLSQEAFAKTVEKLLIENYGLQLSYRAKKTIEAFHSNGATPLQCMHFIAANDGLMPIWTIHHSR